MVLGTAMVGRGGDRRLVERVGGGAGGPHAGHGGRLGVLAAARLAYVSEVVPIEQRGRALSLVGESNRLGLFLGPILGGFLGKYYGLGSAFYAQAAMGLAASTLMFNRRPPRAPARRISPDTASADASRPRWSSTGTSS